MTSVEGNRNWRPKWGLLVAALVLLALAAGVALTAAQPAVADRLGYALARPDGLPGHFTYNGQDYTNPHLCAGGAACHPEAAQRMSQQDLAANRMWPLKQVASLPTFIGGAQPIYAPANDLSMTGANGSDVSNKTPFTLIVADPAAPGRYFLYTRPGGP